MTSSETRPVLLTARQAAQRLSLHPVTLARWRQSGRGPAWLRLGSAIRYDLLELQSYLAAARHDGGGSPPESPRRRAS